MSLQGLFKKMAESGAGQPKRMTLESGPMAFHYILANNVAFLTLADKVGEVALAVRGPAEDVWCWRTGTDAVQCSHQWPL
jgi:hypothetical protein